MESDRKSALLDSAEELIQRMGSNAMSYQDLSERVGIRKASIHYHFPHKEDLILALQGRCEQSYHERYEAIANGTGTATAKLIAFASVFADSVRQGKLCVATMLGAEYGSLGADSREALNRTITKTIGIITAIVTEGVESGEFAPTDQPQELAFAYFSFLMGGHLIARGTDTIDAFETAARAFVERLQA